MKKVSHFILLIILVSCDSYFDIEVEDVVVPIPDPFDEDAVPPETFGLSNSYCYGFNEPQNQTKAEITIPEIFDQSFDLSALLPRVGSQGQQGSCVGWATGYYLKSFQENLEEQNNGEPIFNNEMSPAYVYNQIKVGSCDDGSQIPDALDLVLNSGIVTIEEMPYNQNECSTLPTSEQNILAAENKIFSYSYLDGDILFDQAKAFLLNNTPIVIAISIDDDFFGVIDENGDAVYREFGEVDGAHAMLVVGYDDNRNAFKAVNSWGKNWGNDGFVWIDYGAFKEVLDTESSFKVLCEAWVSVDVTP